MAEDDIYNSKRHYETIVQRWKDCSYCKKGAKGNTKQRGAEKYIIKNKSNCKYITKLVKEFEYLDMSYIRRINYLKAFKKTCSLTSKDVKDLDREDVKGMITKLNKVHKTANTRREYVYLNKKIWKWLFPELDHKGRPDDTIVPYAWRVKVHVDKSSQRDRQDKFTDGEYLKIMQALNKDVRMQCYLSMLYECLARPQELLYLNVGDVTLYDNYARVRVGQHGKEGTKDLQVIDGYYYLGKWLNNHPRPKGDKSPLFPPTSNNKKCERMTPFSVTRVLTPLLKKLGIEKKITSYSFKRNGVTSRYKRGEPAQNIQKIAGWTSTKQLKTYDLSEQVEYLDAELIKRGIIKPSDKGKSIKVDFKQCAFCNEINPKSLHNCSKCGRPLSRKKIIEQEKAKDAELSELKEQMKAMQEQRDKDKEDMLEMFRQEIKAIKK